MTSQSERRAATIAAIISAAQELFTATGFDATSIDDIAESAGVAKGAVYHHFASKEQIFARVFEQMTAALAAEVVAAAASGASIIERFERGTLKYLTSIAGDKFRRVLLTDGPAVLGWEKWREIDARYFGGAMQAPIDTKRKPQLSAREIEAIGHLLAGAIAEAALVCATSAHRVRTARDFTSALVKMLAPFFE
ncbi:MAG TPA: helix-turn-helix domain-containing protein [Candidatus Binataceae bacterium]|nr:helix-turn-helix domain-containing protein [Candidatus Binataceae bacterium]